MKLYRLIALVVLACFAQLGFATGATKLAVLDVQAVVLLSDFGKAHMAELEKNPDYISLKAKFDNTNAELKVLDDQAKTNGLTWGEEQKTEHTKKQTELAKEQQTILRSLNRRREGLYMQLQQILEPAIARASEMVMLSEGIEMIINKQAVVINVPTADISQMVTNKVNELSAKHAESTAGEGKEKKKSK